MSSKICGDCKYFGVMKHDTLNICKCKDSNWYVIDFDKPACKHFEKVEERKDGN